MNRFFLILILLLITDFQVLGQSVPRIGYPMPDFTLMDITHYKDNSASLSDFKGKWLFLDFWFTGCTSCIHSFPKISALREKFKNDAEFILVGLNDHKRNRGIKDLYEKFRKKQNLQMPSAYDSVLVSRWNIVSMPHVFVIDPNGILYNISDGRDFDVVTISKLISGERINLFRKDSDRVPFNPLNLSYDRSKIFYHSVLSRWSGQAQSMRMGIKDEIKYLKDSTGMSFSMVPLKWLYGWAYMGYCMWDSPSDSLYGLVYPDLILEIKNNEYFVYDFNKDVGRGTYNYSLIVPPNRVSIGSVKKIMQQDLNDVFGYDIRIETRRMPVWNLVVVNSKVANRLATKGGSPFVNSADVSGGAAGFVATNVSMGWFLENIMSYMWMGQPPYFDETGIKFNIDVEFNTILTDFIAVRRELNGLGLDLIKGWREMKVIVITDPE